MKGTMVRFERPRESVGAIQVARGALVSKWVKKSVACHAMLPQKQPTQIKHWVSHIWHIVFRRGIVLAYDKGLNTGISGTSGFAASDLGEKDLELRVEKSDVLAAEDLGDKGSARTKDMGCDVECRQQELSLDVFVHVVKSSNYREKKYRLGYNSQYDPLAMKNQSNKKRSNRTIGSTIADNNISLLAVKVRDNLIRSRLFGDISLKLNNSWQRRLEKE